MRILALTSRLPYPPDRGDRLRVYNFLKSLSRQHRISLISFIESQAEYPNIVSLEPFCDQIHVIEHSRLRSVISVGINSWQKIPLQVLYYRSSTMQKIVDQTIRDQQFDMVYTHLARMAPYVENLDSIYRVIDLTDLISKEIQLSIKYRNILSRIMYQIELKRIKKYEKKVIDNFDETWLISETEWESASQSSPNANLQVVRNGVDTTIFHPLKIERIPHRLIFVGHLSVFHNVDAAVYFVQHIFPIIQTQIPDVEFCIVGRDPSPKLITLEQKSGVTVTGYVEDLNLALNQAAVFVAPLRFAAGVQNKVLEAMATGIPVVATPLVAAGIGAVEGQDLISANLDVEFSQSVIRLLENPESARRVGIAGHHYVHEHYSWDLVLHRTNTIENQVLAIDINQKRRST